MKSLILAAGLAGLSIGTPAFAEEQTVSIGVSELSCPSCGFIVGRAMKSVESVEIVDFIEGENPETAVFVVTYDDASVTPDMIVEAVLGYGYPARLIDAPKS